MHLHRFSNTDSGFMSAHSHRCSGYSKRSSQQSSVSCSHKQSSSVISEMIKSDSVTQNLHTEGVTVKNVQNFTHKVSSNSSISSTVTITSNNQLANLVVDGVGLVPPAIPQKTRRKQDRQSSPYDNVSEGMWYVEKFATQPS